MGKPQVKVLLAEMAVVEEEIVLLERKVGKLKLHLDHEQHITNKWEMKIQQQMQKEKHIPLTLGPTNNLRCFSDLDNKKELRRYKIIRDKKTCHTSSDISTKSTTLDETWTEDMGQRSRILESQSLNQRQFRRELKTHRPNDLSEQLIKCLIDVFLKMNQSSMDSQGYSDAIPKLNIPCVNSTFNCKSSALPSNDGTRTSFDPYGVLSDIYVAARDIGPYNRFIPITRGSLDVSHCFHASNGSLRVLLYKLSHVDLTHLGYKQKLAFWINIYNACIMHAFLQHGLPSSHDKSLSLMNKAALNVGGIVLNALAIEHFILRHPCESTAHSNEDDEEEMLLRHAYGLGYPEPNITFALCRGSWSSPALRVYTAEDVVNELGRARVEYLEAAIGITSKRRIVVPKLLECHMKDFADDLESLLEWIYSHTPRNGQLKKLIMECLNGDTKSHTDKLVVIQPYESEFRYLIPPV
ncbi:hypothetical protein QQ045_021204 [Rhodiola kirilowii]